MHWKLLFLTLIVLSGMLFYVVIYLNPQINWGRRALSVIHTVLKCDTLQGNAEFRQKIAAELFHIRNSLLKTSQLNHTVSLKTVNEIDEIIYSLDSRILDNALRLQDNSRRNEVCPEVYMGTFYGENSTFTEGFVTVPCLNNKPLFDLITIAIDASHLPKSTTVQLLFDIEKTYFNLTVLIATSIKINYLYKTLNIKIISSNNKTPSQIWNHFLTIVKTPYILIGRDLEYFMWHARLERQIRVLGDLPGVEIVGGSYRHSDGNWTIGCLQTKFSNYILKYQEGYYHSKNECLYCDHLMGPFVARVSTLDALKFDTNLNSDIIFEDLFLRYRSLDYLVMNCPDVMYFASNNSKIDNRNSWLSLVAKWEINKVVLSNGLVHSFDCNESNSVCHAKEITIGYTLPLCCIEMFDKAFKVLVNFLETKNIKYVMYSGSALGAVKMKGLLPWDLDGDLHYDVYNHSIILKNKEYIKSLGYELELGSTPKCCDGKQRLTEGSFSFLVDKLYFEMFATNDIMLEKFLQDDMRPTRIKIHGILANGPPNPGLYVRNRYGIEIFKHAQSWITMKKEHSYVEYTAGFFLPCPTPGHHACLDQFNTDGNIQFQMP